MEERGDRGGAAKEASSTASTGAARKARERRARAQARHVLWLAGNWQVLASHHTRPATEVEWLRKELASVRQELASLKATLEVELQGVRLTQGAQEAAAEAEAGAAPAATLVGVTASSASSEQHPKVPDAEDGDVVHVPVQKQGQVPKASVLKGKVVPVPVQKQEQVHHQGVLHEQEAKRKVKDDASQLAAACPSPPGSRHDSPGRRGEPGEEGSGRAMDKKKKDWWRKELDELEAIFRKR